MKITIDEKADALYLRLDESKIIESVEAASGVILDFNASEQVVGIEVHNLSQRSNAFNIREVLLLTSPACAVNAKTSG